MSELDTREPTVVEIYESDDGTNWVIERADEGYYVETNVETGFQRVTHPDGFKAAFDLTRTWGRDVWRDLMDMFDLEFNEVEITTDPGRDDGDWTVFAWAGEDLVIRTSTNPLNGEKANYHTEREKAHYDPDDNLAYCGYIHLEGDEDAVTTAYEHIKNNSNYKEASLGRWCV